VANEYGEVLSGEPDSNTLENFLAKHHRADPLRFPDLITARLLKVALAHQPQPYSNAELVTHCTRQEDAAQKVERQMRKLLRGANALRLGEQQRVKLVATNVERRFIDFEAG